MAADAADRAATANPTEALIRARAAVPASHRPGIAVRPPAPAARPAVPSDAVALAGAAMPQEAAAANASGGPAPSTTPSTDDPPPDIAFMMRDALTKYEALMKSRTGPSISGDF